jgi:AcrR family transcriptional regulator
MRTPSQNASAGVREPRRARGRQRVAALLEAAAAVFAEKGFDNATMTEIAARAGASIGSLYQFFPTKELLAEALLARYAEALFETLLAYRDAAAGWSTDALADRLVRTLIEFRAGHPAFGPLIDVHGAPDGKPAEVGLAVRAHLLAILQAKAPGLAPEVLAPVAIAVQQVMKAAVSLNAERDLPARDVALDELAAMLRGYLRDRLS